MSVAHPLFAPPTTPSREELRQACASWVAILSQVRRSTGRSRRDLVLRLTEKYRTLYEQLLDACDEAIESSDEPQRRYIEHMKHFLAPWVDPAALIHVSGAILDDLIRQASEFECLLRGLDPVQVERRKKLTRQVVTVGIVLGFVILFVMLSGGPEAMIDSANSTQTQYVELVNGITPRVKIGLSALVVLAIGAVSLRSMRRD